MSEYTSRPTDLEKTVNLKILSSISKTVKREASPPRTNCKADATDSGVNLKSARLKEARSQKPDASSGCGETTGAPNFARTLEANRRPGEDEENSMR